MKILITYASAGTGHHKAAEALFNYLTDNYKEVQVRLLDVLKEAHPLFRLNYTWGYSYLITYMPLAWEWAFWVTYNKALRFLTRPIARFTNWLNTLDFAKDIRNENPDFVISTHFLPSEITASLKKSKKITSRLVTVITDFGVHPYWFSEPTDLYVVASGYTKKELTAIRIDEARIMESGIPIDAKFSQKYDRNQICRKLGLMPDTFTVLVITGSFGIGPIEEIARALGGEAQVLAVCARNEKLYQRLKEKDYPGVRPFGFVDNIHELMAASDVIVTKPGGLSTSELLAMELVPVFICAIAGQETFNIEALASYGIESRADSVSGVRKMVLDYKNNPEKLRSVKDKIRRIGKPRAAGDLCDAVCKGGIGAGS